MLVIWLMGSSGSWSYSRLLLVSSLMPLFSVIKLQEFDISCMNMQEKNSLPLPKVEGDDRTQARALATHYSHPVVSLWVWICLHFTVAVSCWNFVLSKVLVSQINDLDDSLIQSFFFFLSRWCDPNRSSLLELLWKFWVRILDQVAFETSIIVAHAQN